FSGVRVLVVDDSAVQRSVLAEKLTEWKMLVTAAGSAGEALRILRAAEADARPFAVALLDRSMPGIDGLELKRAIVDDTTLTARLVLITGLSHERDLDEAELHGICASLSKPIHTENLRSCIRIALGLQV